MIKIFAVDDDLHLLETIIIQIEQEGGYDIEGASSLKEAKAKLADVDPDLVILDVMLPGRSGYDILRDLRSDSATADVPVMMLTARGQAKDRDMAIRLGATHFMTKPFSNADFLESVRALATP